MDGWKLLLAMTKDGRPSEKRDGVIFWHDRMMGHQVRNGMESSSGNEKMGHLVL